MIQSMTGYGKAKISVDNKNFNIEIKSLNSKQIDMNIKMRSIYKEKEYCKNSKRKKKLS